MACSRQQSSTGDKLDGASRQDALNGFLLSRSGGSANQTDSNKAETIRSASRTPVRLHSIAPQNEKFQDSHTLRHKQG